MALSIKSTTTKRWHLFVDGVKTRGDYGTPRLAMEAADTAMTHVVAARIAEVHAIQRPLSARRTHARA
jgi:hypothetical protein